MFEVEVQDGQIQVSLEVMQLIEQARELDIMQKENDIKMAQFRENLKNAMEKYGIKKWENPYMTAIYKESTTKKSVDINALKEQGLYESFLKETPVKASIMVKFNDE